MTEEALIAHLANSALWMANIRAGESRRPDAVFRDELAAHLSGEEGPQLERSIPHALLSSWAVVIRTSAVDRLIGFALQERIDTVLNLGAGLDARPYRMELRADLRWIEVDFPHLIAGKDAKLRDRRPQCMVERIGMDVRDRSRRSELFASLGVESERTLLITEGLIPYLTVEQAAALAYDARAIPAFRFWIQDFDDAGERRALLKSWDEIFTRARPRFKVKDWFKFFLNAGWSPKERITSAEEAQRLERPFPLTFPLGALMRILPASMRRKVLSTSGAVLMEQCNPRKLGSSSSSH